MLIHLNTTDVSVVGRVYQLIQAHDPESTIYTEPDAVKGYVPGSGHHLLTAGYIESPADVATHRWAHLMLASLGGRFWVESEESLIPSPYIAGQLDKIADLQQVITDAAYAEARAAYFRSFGVSYLGRVFEDPRTIVLLDNKKDKSFHPQLHDNVRKILQAMPETTSQKGERSWGALALVSAGNVDKLGEFLDYLSETNVVAYSESAFAKLKHIGRDFGVIAEPNDDDQHYGSLLLDTASRLKPVLSQ